MTGCVLSPVGMAPFIDTTVSSTLRADTLLHRGQGRGIDNA